MSKVEIHYLVLEASRPAGDVEEIINAIGEFQNEKPFPIDRQYDQEPSETADGAAFIKLKRVTRNQQYTYELLEEAERMRAGVEKHFSDEDRDRLSRHFAGVAILDAFEAE